MCATSQASFHNNSTECRCQFCRRPSKRLVLNVKLFGHCPQFLSKHCFSFLLLPSGVVTANHLPPSNHILCILFSYTIWLHDLCATFLLFPSSRPAGCQYQLQHQNSHFLPLKMSTASPKHHPSNVLIPDHRRRHPPPKYITVTQPVWTWTEFHFFYHLDRQSQNIQSAKHNLYLVTQPTSTYMPFIV